MICTRQGSNLQPYDPKSLAFIILYCSQVFATIPMRSASTEELLTGYGIEFGTVTEWFRTSKTCKQCASGAQRKPFKDRSPLLEGSRLQAYLYPSRSQRPHTEARFSELGCLRAASRATP